MDTFQYLQWQYGAILLFVVWLGSVYWSRWRLSVRIAKLGEEAQIIKTRWPYGLDFPIWSTRAILKNETLEFWQWIFSHTGTDENGNGSYTADLRIMKNIRVIFTADPENIKAFLTTQFQDYGKGEEFHKDWEDFLGDSIFTTDGTLWHGFRQLIRPMFIRDRVADLPLVETHVRKLISLLGPGDGRMIRLDTLFFQFSLDAATHFLFGHSVESLGNEQSDFAKAFDEIQRVKSLEGRLGPFRQFYSKKTFYRSLKTMEGFIEPWIEEALSLSPEELDSKLTKSDTFIHALARFTRDRKVMRDQLVALLLAGRDTTASTLSWFFLELSTNPQVVEKLRAEIAQHGLDDGHPPSWQEVKDMKYLTYAINETLRLYPVVPFNVRASVKDTTLPRGGGVDGNSRIGIPKGTPIGYSTLLMQRRRDLYPPVSESFPYDPLDWVPDRWATWTPKSWQFIPFNGGPRICIGQQFAMVEMGYTIIRILQQFDQITDYGNDRQQYAQIVLIPANGVKVGFVKRAAKAEKA